MASRCTCERDLKYLEGELVCETDFPIGLSDLSETGRGLASTKLLRQFPASAPTQIHAKREAADGLFTW